jgi:SOS response regulatory protein OraA/RecX
MQELSNKGVAQETVKAALEEAGDEDARALKAAQRFANKEMTVQLQAKAWRFLMSRGFSSAAIKKAMKAIASSTAANDNEDFSAENVTE